MNDHDSGPAMRERMTTERRIRLRYAGSCRVCGRILPIGTLAMWDPGLHRVRCTSCAPTTASGPSQRLPTRPSSSPASDTRPARRRPFKPPPEPIWFSEDAAPVIPPKARRIRERVWAVIIATVVVAFSLFFSAHGSTIDNEWTVEPQAATLVRTFVGFEPRHCADGWPSPSIGKRGACSHHGGVVGGEPIYQTQQIPAVEGIRAPERTDWGHVVWRGFWSLLVGGMLGRWTFKRFVRHA
ncbi:hypothetical protein ACQFYA_21295 [Promicromonospora sp. Marseille-Q5078]